MYMRGLTVGLALFASSMLWACGGISDCKEDGAKCAEVLNANGDKCAGAYILRTSERKRKYCEKAVKIVGKQKVKAAVPGLLKMLAVPPNNQTEDRHQIDAAGALMKIGDPSAVDGLAAALHMDAGTSSDYADKNANRANEKIASALGSLGDKKASGPLLKLFGKTNAGGVRLKIIRALGKVGDEKAVDALSDVALTDPEKFLRKTAVISLGEIASKSPKSIDTLVQMMFVEFKGVSFYKEASYALYRVGPASVDKLLETMNMKNKAVNTYFEKIGGVKESAIKAKCAYVLSDLRDKRGVEPVIEAFKAAIDKADPVVLGFAPPAMAAFGDKRAIEPLRTKMETLDASLRGSILRALNQLGDVESVPKLIETMTADHFVTKCFKDKMASKAQCAADKPSLWAAQKAAVDHASNLAQAEHYDAFKKVVDGEKEAEMKKYFTARFKKVEAAKECKKDVGCWSKKLKDKDPLIREKAAWELGRIGGKSVIDPLTEALGDKKPEARSAAIMVYYNVGDKRAVPSIKKRLEDEVSRADYIKVNEDLKRLLIFLERS